MALTKAGKRKPPQTPRARIARAAVQGAVEGALPGPVRGAIQGARGAATPAPNPAPKRNAPKPNPSPTAPALARARMTAARDLEAMGAVRMSGHVLALEYFHAQSAQGRPYRHDFESDGVELWALPDGALFIRSRRLRLWADFDVSGGE